MFCSLVLQKTLINQGKKIGLTPVDLLAISLCMLWHVVTDTKIQTHCFKTLIDLSNLYNGAKWHILQDVFEWSCEKPILQPCLLCNDWFFSPTLKFSSNYYPKQNWSKICSLSPYLSKLRQYRSLRRLNRCKIPRSISLRLLARWLILCKLDSSPRLYKHSRAGRRTVWWTRRTYPFFLSLFSI